MSKTIIVLLLLGLLATLHTHTDGAKIIKCNCNCSLQPNPVCAQDKVTKKTETFNNACMLKCYNCTNDKNYIILQTGECGTTGK